MRLPSTKESHSKGVGNEAWEMTNLAQLERQKAELLSTIEGWSEARLAYRPEPGGWSTAEMLDHIVKVESGILTAARSGLQKPHRIGIRDRLGFLFVERVFKSDRRVKVPASAAQVLPNKEPDLPGLLDRWRRTREELTLFVEQLSSNERKAGIFRHPVCGWMDIQRILDFFSVHILHHGFQLARLSAASEGF